MNVLIIDDEPGLRSGLAKLLTLQGYNTLEAASAAEVRKLLLTTEIHLMLLDLRLGDQDGLALLKEVKAEEPAIPVIIITGHGDIYSAVECMKAGATNYIPKPIDHGLLLSIIEKESVALRDRLATLGFRESLRSAARTRLVPSTSAEMKEIERIVEKVRDSDVPVLLLGETGTGKEVIAKIIHYTGAYCDRPFVGLNCASLNENLLESELFGHEKGAFSGAIARKIGRFELAGSGTLFLDEIGDMSLSMQSKLLRVLQEKTLERVGGTKPVSVYCRLIAATNKDLAALRARGEFREDLYYRLSTVTLKLPPLRDRTRDIPALVRTFVEEANAAYGRSVKSIPDRDHAQPDDSPLARQHTAAEERDRQRGHPQRRGGDFRARVRRRGEAGGGDLSSTRICPARWPGTRGEIEKKIIRSVLEKNKGNITKSATRLGISRKTLYEKIRRHELWQAPDARESGESMRRAATVILLASCCGSSRHCAFGGALPRRPATRGWKYSAGGRRAERRRDWPPCSTCTGHCTPQCSSSTRPWPGGRGRTPRRSLPPGCRAAIPRTPSRSTPGTSSSIRGCLPARWSPSPSSSKTTGGSTGFPGVSSTSSPTRERSTASRSTFTAPMSSGTIRGSSPRPTCARPRTSTS